MPLLTIHSGHLNTAPLYLHTAGGVQLLIALRPVISFTILQRQYEPKVHCSEGLGAHFSRQLVEGKKNLGIIWKQIETIALNLKRSSTQSLRQRAD